MIPPIAVVVTALKNGKPNPRASGIPPMLNLTLLNNITETISQKSFIYTTSFQKPNHPHHPIREQYRIEPLVHHLLHPTRK